VVLITVQNPITQQFVRVSYGTVKKLKLALPNYSVLRTDNNCKAKSSFDEVFTKKQSELHKRL